MALSLTPGQAADITQAVPLLDRVEPDGAVPVIGDANSMAYVLHRGLGEDLPIRIPEPEALCDGPADASPAAAELARDGDDGSHMSYFASPM
mgnify:CR=1 FL=1